MDIVCWISTSNNNLYHVKTQYRYLYINIYIVSHSKYISHPLDIYDIYRYLSRVKFPNVHEEMGPGGA